MAKLKKSYATVTTRTADSPVLTTPALGTPSAGVMTNMTGAVEASFVDNAVTLAKMAGGTDGNVISYDASGNPVAIATGSDGQALTSTGAGSPPAMEALSGGGDSEPYFLAKHSTAQSIATGSTVQLLFDSTDVNVDTVWDTTNSAFLPTTAGWYVVNVMMSLETATDFDGDFKIWFTKNGDYTFNHTQEGGGTHYDSNVMMGMVELDGSGDWVKAYVNQTQGGAINSGDGTGRKHNIFGWRLI